MHKSSQTKTKTERRPFTAIAYPTYYSAKMPIHSHHKAPAHHVCSACFPSRACTLDCHTWKYTRLVTLQTQKHAKRGKKYRTKRQGHMHGVSASNSGSILPYATVVKHRQRPMKHSHKMIISTLTVLRTTLGIVL